MEVSFKDNGEKFGYDLQLLKELMEETLTPSIAAYDVLIDSEYEGDSAYQLSLGFLSIANQSYIEAKNIYNEKELEAIEIDPFFKTFKDYKFELTQYISERDNNPSWLSTRKDQFIDGCNGVIEFIVNHLKIRNEI